MDPLWWHLPLILGISIGFESAFIHHGLNVFDEGWALYGAMRLHAGGVLYRDVFSVFPPGHVLCAWIGFGLAPPGVVLARTLYAGFNVALCVGFYFLGRRFLPAHFALLGALLLALAAPRAHLAHYHFGYRYLVFSVLALLAFAERLRTGNSRWMLAAGACAGVALCFRLTPAFAVSAAAGFGVVLADRDWRRWPRDWGWFALGLVTVAAPVVAWFAHGVGLETLWRDVVVRPVAMTDLQSMEIPDILLPESWTRRKISKLFTAVQFRSWAILYCGYAAVLAVQWVRALLTRRRFEPVLLAVVVVWGGVFFARTLGRSDVGHLESALPPVCLVLAHLASRLLPWQRRGEPCEGWAKRLTTAGVVVGTLAVWVFLFGTDQMLSADSRGTFPIEVLNGRISVPWNSKAKIVDQRVMDLVDLTEPGDTILDLSAAPLFHVLTGRPGPGWFDVVIPGTFLSEDEERAFVERLEASPPALVVTSVRPFDDMRARAASVTAPLVARWVRAHYRIHRPTVEYILWLPRESAG
jgi:hypothetical protein